MKLLLIGWDQVLGKPYDSNRCDMAFIEPMHRNKPNMTYLVMTLTPEGFQISPLKFRRVMLSSMK